MVPSILLLPSELKHRIAELSSRKSLTALAQTHSAYQREAEQALYHTISILTRNDASLKCLETLATNPGKTALVRFLTMESARNNIDENRTAMTYLLKGLINMHSLSDFRVRMRHGEIAGRMVKNLCKILCEGHFRLQTLYCNDNLDISRIIKTQTELQILGLYSNGDQGNLLKTLRKLHNAQISLPIVLTLECDSFLPIFHQISIFPAFYSAERCATIYQILTQSFSKDQGFYMLISADRVTDLSIYLTDSSDMPTIHALAKDMAVSFPQISWLGFWFGRQFQITPKEKEIFLSFFSNLRGVNFYQWPSNAYPNMSEDDALALQQNMLRKLRPRVGREVNQGLYKT